jgi:hypothetical protein
MDDLYDADILAWSEEQAELLRRLAAGELVNDRIDWLHLIEEIESVGNEQLHAVNSLLLQTLLHILKVTAWPDSRDVPHWRGEAELFRAQAADRFVPSMRQRIDLERIYRRARRAMPETIDGVAPLPVPATCPHSLDDLLRDD